MARRELDARDDIAQALKTASNALDFIRARLSPMVDLEQHERDELSHEVACMVVHHLEEALASAELMVLREGERFGHPVEPTAVVE